MDKGKKMLVVGVSLGVWLLSVFVWMQWTAIHFPDGSTEINVITVISYIYGTSIGIVLLSLVPLKEFREYIKSKHLTGLIDLVVIVWGITAILASIAFFVYLARDSITGTPLLVLVTGVMAGIPVLLVVATISEYKGYRLDRTITVALVALLILIIIGMAYEGYRAQNDAIEYVMKYYDLLMKYSNLQAECGV